MNTLSNYLNKYSCFILLFSTKLQIIVNHGQKKQMIYFLLLLNIKSTYFFFLKKINK